MKFMDDDDDDDDNIVSKWKGQNKSTQIWPD